MLALLSLQVQTDFFCADCIMNDVAGFFSHYMQILKCSNTANPVLFKL